MCSVKGDSCTFIFSVSPIVKSFVLLYSYYPWLQIITVIRYLGYCKSFRYSCYLFCLLLFQWASFICQVLNMVFGFLQHQSIATGFT